VEIVTIIFIIVIISGIMALVSGFWLAYEHFVVTKKEIKKSLNISLDVIRVIKTDDTENERGKVSREQLEKEEISTMEQLLASLIGLMEGDKGFLKGGQNIPNLIFELAVPAGDEQTSFYIAFPRKLQEVIEKQIHGFFPSAHIERIKDYNIFHPESVTVGSYLKLKRKHFYPIKTYKQLETDPLHAITNSLSKLNDKTEGAAIQIVFHKSNYRWKFQGDKVAQEMQQGLRLNKAVRRSTTMGKVTHQLGKEAGRVFSGKSKDELPDSSPNDNVSLTPQEQNDLEQLDNKSNQPRFDVNIRLLASSDSKERSELILTSMENAFAQFDGDKLNKFRVVRSKMKTIIDSTATLINTNNEASALAEVDKFVEKKSFDAYLATNKIPMRWNGRVYVGNAHGMEFTSVGPRIHTLKEGRK